MGKIEIAKKYMQTAKEKWAEITQKGYLCYENDLELANEIVYKIFEKDIFNDMATYFRQTKNANGKIFKILCEIENGIYFQFDIITRFGIDIPQRISNGKFRILKETPKGWQDIWNLYNELYEE